MKNTSELIRIARATKRVKLCELAKKTGVSTAYLNYIENGKKKTMNMVLYRKICKALCIPKEEMLKAILKDIEIGFNEGWNRRGDR